MYEMERRTLESGLELRTLDGGRNQLHGESAVFNVETTIAGMFREQFAPGAFTTAIKEDDVACLWNHSHDVPLGRKRSGTLRLSETATGLRYEVDLPDTSWGRDILVLVRRGDVSQSSLGFFVVRDEWTKPANRDQLPLRTILEARLIDVSPVLFAAYPTTSVSARSEGVYVR